MVTPISTCKDAILVLPAQPCEQGIPAILDPPVDHIIEKRREGLSHLGPRCNPQCTNDVSPTNGKVAHAIHRPPRQLGRERALERVQLNRALRAGSRLCNGIAALKVQKLVRQGRSLARTRLVERQLGSPRGVGHGT